ncbi:prepilin-type N-terminal cleavage/methylation domain-containing protein [Candidatus Gracilibacteria bacterium]|nr:prepilin-type N-terminal cleavage/methylation domain-containing protein [Candidatus Gracilibacteria bacterium]
MVIYFHKGFTLVELMIVIGIIGILAASLYPQLSSYLARGRNTTRITDIKNINLGLKNYYIDNGDTPNTQSGSEQAFCVGMISGDLCWKDYLYNASEAASRGRASGVYGNTNFNNSLKLYIAKIPNDPLDQRGVGDRYIFSRASGDIHCNGFETIGAGGWIIWQPDKVRPIRDNECLGRGQYACCSGLGCGSHYFCIDRVDI